MQTSFFKAGTLGVSETLYIDFGITAQSVSIIVDNSTNVVSSVTNAASPGASSLWSTLIMTNNGASIAGPITGVRLAANASGGTYSVRAAHLR